MAIRSAAFAVASRSSARLIMDGARGSPSLLPRYFSDSGKGRVLSEEERAAENVYIKLMKKMEKEKMEKAKLKAEREKAEKVKEAATQKPEGK